MTHIVIEKTDKQSTDLQKAIGGETFENFLQSQKGAPQKPGLSNLGAANLRISTTDILNHCNPHDAVKNLETTHLVVGYVQSGKTMSFTGVLAMARDNGYRIAVILTGVTTNLRNQTSERLRKDLHLTEDNNWFKFIDNPTENDISDFVKNYRHSDKPMIIIPILKHKKYILDLATVFANEKIRKILSQETVLIIDDEADQASLNSYGCSNSKISDPKEEEKESAIYSAILTLRAQLPGNTYIQYTATPQANILITTADLLSPKSHTLLIPGEDYIGGKKFFGQEKDGSLYNGKLIRPIPEKEVYHKKQNALTSMPDSLCEALILHIWAVILVIKWYKRPRIKQLSMMVHPTDIIEGNKEFQDWIEDKLNFWSDTFEKPDWSQDKDLELRTFQKYLPAALQFYPEEGRPTFEDVKKFIPDIINESRVYRITGDSDDDGKNIQWNDHKMNILIGAQMLNRGFTVEKLATTYMPRYTLSITNADTIEQRCRFFGYKKDYIESCRVYLPQKSIDEYIDYVHHEEELRTLLASCSTLKEYEHQVMLSPKLRPTRLNVLPNKLVKSKLVGWKKFEHINGPKIIPDNKKVVGEFVKKHIDSAGEFTIQCYTSIKYQINEIKKHRMVMISTTDVISMLTDYVAGTFTESLAKSLMIRYIQYLEQIENRKVMVIFMSNDQIRIRSRKPVEKNGDHPSTDYKIELFQGRSNMTEKDDYCGDTNIFSPDYITMQIHHIGVDSKDNDTYALAIHFPKKLSTAYTTSIDENFEINE